MTFIKARRYDPAAICCLNRQGVMGAVHELPGSKSYSTAKNVFMANIRIESRPAFLREYLVSVMIIEAWRASQVMYLGCVHWVTLSTLPRSVCRLHVL